MWGDGWNGVLEFAASAVADSGCHVDMWSLAMGSMLRGSHAACLLSGFHRAVAP